METINEKYFYNFNYSFKVLKFKPFKFCVHIDD